MENEFKPETSKPFAEPKKPNEQFDLFNKGEWIKYIPGDVQLWHGYKVDVKYLTGESADNVTPSCINWDTVAKYRKSQEPKDPRLDSNLGKFTTIHGDPASKALTTQQGTEVDPNSRYYDAGGIETIEVIKAKLTPEQLKGYLLGNVIKYISRLNFKGTAVRDAEKLKFYANWLEQLK